MRLTRLINGAGAQVKNSSVYGSVMLCGHDLRFMNVWAPYTRRAWRIHMTFTIALFSLAWAVRSRVPLLFPGDDEP